jgi:hypothetical protein
MTREIEIEGNIKWRNPSETFIGSFGIFAFLVVSVLKNSGQAALSMTI